MGRNIRLRSYDLRIYGLRFVRSVCGSAPFHLPVHISISTNRRMDRRDVPVCVPRGRLLTPQEAAPILGKVRRGMARTHGSMRLFLLLTFFSREIHCF